MTLYDDHNPTRQRFALQFEYNGAFYSGSQRQDHPELTIPTVQAELENALHTLGVNVAHVLLASRTDAGVHAEAQVAHFDAPAGALDTINCLRESMNAVLPESIAIRDVQTSVAPHFHARNSAALRWYRYTLLNTPSRRVMTPPGVAWFRKPLDEQLMQQAASRLIGRHNCQALACSGSLSHDNVCHIQVARVSRCDDFVVLDIVADHFLYRMVRNLVTILCLVGTHTHGYDPDVLVRFLQETNPGNRRAPVSPEGLVLKAIAYPPELEPFPESEPVVTLNSMIKLESPTHEDLFRKAS